MFPTGFFKLLITIQGIYYGVTGMWPLLHIGSFMAVTGPKVDLWLVKMVGLLALSTGVCLLYSRMRNQYPDVIIILAVTNAISFGVIDVVYASRDIISGIYLSDALAQALFLVGYGGALISRNRPGQPTDLLDANNH